MLLSCLRVTKRAGAWRFVKSPRATVNLMWTAGLFLFGVQGIMQTAARVLQSTQESSRAEGLVVGGVFYGAAFLCCGVLCTSFVRSRIQACLRGSGSSAAQETSAAAGISALLGGIDSNEALKLGLSSFRALTASALTRQDLAASTASPELHIKTRQAAVGEVDFFLSHSWSDESDSKWQALQTVLGEEVEANKGREVLLWLDKACINQTSIATALQSLPVHLAGCKRLLILCGPSYIHRLWTLMEIFVFVHGGGSVSRMKVVPLADKVHAGESTGTLLLKSFGRIDVASAGCGDSEVRQRLLGIIESAFGDTRSFNQHVESLLSTAADKGTVLRRRSLTRTTKRSSDGSVVGHPRSEHGPVVV